MIELTAKHKRILRWVGYPLLALCTFIIALHLTFPYDRVEDKVIEILSSKYDVEIGDTSPTWLPGGLIFESVVLRTRPSKPDEKPTIILLDEVRIDVGLLALIGGTIDLDIEAKVESGRLDAQVVIDGASWNINAKAKQLPVANIPGVSDAVGLPMDGYLDAKIKLALDDGRWDKLNGKIELECPGCTVGDGKARIKPRAPPGRRRRISAFAGQGMKVPRLQLGKLVGNIQITDGQGKIEKFAAVDSPDGSLELFGGVRFARRFGDSRLDPGTCMRFELSDGLKQREKEFGNFPELMGVPANEDGTYNVTLKGKLTAMQRRPGRVCDPSQGAGGRDKSERPTITTRPDPADRPGADRPGADPRSPLTRRLEGEPTGDDDEGDKDEGDKGEGDEDDAGRDIRGRRPGLPGQTPADAIGDAARRAARNLRGDDVGGNKDGADGDDEDERRRGELIRDDEGRDDRELVEPDERDEGDEGDEIEPEPRDDEEPPFDD